MSEIDPKNSDRYLKDWLFSKLVFKMPVCKIQNGLQMPTRSLDVTKCTELSPVIYF